MASESSGISVASSGNCEPLGGSYIVTLVARSWSRPLRWTWHWWPWPSCQPWWCTPCPSLSPSQESYYNSSPIPISLISPCLQLSQLARKVETKHSDTYAAPLCMCDRNKKICGSLPGFVGFSASMASPWFSVVFLTIAVPEPNVTIFVLVHFFIILIIDMNHMWYSKWG